MKKQTRMITQEERVALFRAKEALILKQQRDYINSIKKEARKELLNTLLLPLGIAMSLISILIYFDLL